MFPAPSGSLTIPQVATPISELRLRVKPAPAIPTTMGRVTEKQGVPERNTGVTEPQPPERPPYN